MIVHTLLHSNLTVERGSDSRTHVFVVDWLDFVGRPACVDASWAPRSVRDAARVREPRHLVNPP